MKDITSLEKSKTLKAAGVIPPTFDVGQVWYSRNDEKFVTTAVSHDEIHGLHLNAGFYWYNTMEYFTYAFTISDLLPMLPPDTTVQMLDGQFFVKIEGENPKRFTGDNMAEVLAEAVLHTLAT